MSLYPDLERSKFLRQVKEKMCSGLPCSTCPMENYCMYGEDVHVEVYGYYPKNRS